MKNKTVQKGYLFTYTFNTDSELWEIKKNENLPNFAPSISTGSYLDSVLNGNHR